MDIIKIRDMFSSEAEFVYINAQEISSFKYNKESNQTEIILNNETFVARDGDIANELAKTIVNATKGSILNMG